MYYWLPSFLKNNVIITLPQTRGHKPERMHYNNNLNIKLNPLKSEGISQPEQMH